MRLGLSEVAPKRFYYKAGIGLEIQILVFISKKYIYIYKFLLEKKYEALLTLFLFI